LTSELELRERDSTERNIDVYRASFQGPGENDVVDFVLGEEATADGARRFRVIGPHAQGGLGEVFVAHDEHLDRKVALKRIIPELAGDERSRERFIGEAEITGQLEHPNIAPVYSVGMDRDKLPFYATRFIDGQPLGDAIAHFHDAHAPGSDEGARLLALRKLLGRFNAVCDAVAFAHSRGVLHRDIKPANVILGRFGETILVDWGLAKRIGAPESNSLVGLANQRQHDGGRITEQGSVLGTLLYMSPEQAQSATGTIGPASDVYSLGATLYHLLTGVPPFAGTDHEELRRKVIRGEFRAPREVD
jgi:serine/threonine protein kinase